MVDPTLLELALKLPHSERLELADALLKSIAGRDPELTEAVRAQLADAGSDVAVNPTDERSWSEVRRELFPHLA